MPTSCKKFPPGNSIFFSLKFRVNNLKNVVDVIFKIGSFVYAFSNAFRLYERKRSYLVNYVLKYILNLYRDGYIFIVYFKYT